MQAWIVAAVLGLAIAGCQRAPALAPAPSGEILGSLTERLRAEGDALMKQQRYEEAAVKYQAALNEVPSDIRIRFALAVALSYLPRREETIEHFRIVVRRGAPGSVEVATAREWLASAGVRETGGASTAPAARDSAAEAEAAARQGKVRGKLSWRAIDPRDKLVRVNVSLTGDDVGTRDVKLGRNFMLGRGYEFRDVPPGAYRLVAEVAGTTMWNLKVEVPAAGPTTLDLTESNSAVSGDFDPPAAD
jgi:tetratricopeptide (TPR) repeat protein